MKKIVFLLLMSPVFCFAQKDKEETNKLNDGILNLVHADKTISVPAPKKDERKKQKDNTKYIGAVQFKIGGNIISCDSALVIESDNLVEAYNVTITNPEYFTTKGEVLKYNKDTKQGTVENKITVAALNGNVIGTSDNVAIDLKTEVYRIGMGNITPPEPAK